MKNADQIDGATRTSATLNNGSLANGRGIMPKAAPVASQGAKKATPVEVTTPAESTKLAAEFGVKFTDATELWIVPAVPLIARNNSQLSKGGLGLTVPFPSASRLGGTGAIALQK